MKNSIILLLLVSTLFVGCKDDETAPKGDEVKSIPDMTFTTKEFKPGETIPDNFTCVGTLNISPQLSWSGAPAETKSYAIIVDDPDAKPDVWDHWLVYNLPASVSSLANARTQQSIESEGGNVLVNSFGYRTYSGPCPPTGETHTYRFKIYALDTVELSAINSKSDKIDLVNAINDHIVAQGSFTGTFGR